MFWAQNPALSLFSDLLETRVGEVFAGAKEESHTLGWFELQQVFDRVRKDEQVNSRGMFERGRNRGPKKITIVSIRHF